MIKIEVHDREVLDAFNRLQAASIDLTPSMRAIGELLIESTKRRFDTSTGPDGERWAPNTRATMEALLTRGSGQFAAYSDVSTRKRKYTRAGTKAGYFLKDGALGYKGRNLMMHKKPLVDLGLLQATIGYDADADRVLVGSPMEYAGTHQFGAVQGALGRTRRNVPIPWGDIPARPFLGVSNADRDGILEILQNHLRVAKRG